MKRLRKQGFRGIIFFDDAAPASPPKRGKPANQTEGREEFLKIEELFGKLGIKPHPSKGEKCGSTKLKNLGATAIARRQLLLAPPTKLRSLQEEAKRPLANSRRSRRWLRVRGLRSFASKALATGAAAHLGRLRAREIFHSIGGRKSGSARISHAAVRDLELWAKRSDANQIEEAIWKSPGRTLFSDANSCGRGGGAPKLAAAGYFNTKSRNLRVNAKEIRAKTCAIMPLPKLAREKSSR